MKNIKYDKKRYLHREEVIFLENGDSTFDYYIYLDWNIINRFHQLVCQKNKSIFVNEPWLSFILCNLIPNPKICFPHSQGHLEDILRSEKEYHKSCLQILKEVSKGYRIFEDTAKPNTFYQSQRDDLEADMMGIEDHLMRYDWLYKMGEDPYLELVRNRCIKYPIMIEQLSKYDNKSLRKFIYDELDKYNFPFKTLEKFTSWMERNYPNPMVSELTSKIINCALFCDIVGITREDVNDKLFNYQGFATDTSLHLPLGLRLGNFVTCDKRLALKAVLCKIMLDINANVFFIDKNQCNYYSCTLLPLKL